MAKRSADVQINNRDNPGDSDDNGSWGATSGPQKATAAQLANRRSPSHSNTFPHTNLLFSKSAPPSSSSSSSSTDTILRIPPYMSYSPSTIDVLVKVSEDHYFALMAAKRARIDRIAQPRGGRRTAATASRRPPAPPSPALNNQQQLPAFGQSNGIQQSQSGGGFTFGQKQQPVASASFPPVGKSNNTGNSSNFTPPSSSFSFGSQLSANPFAPAATFGNNNNNGDQTTAQVQYSPSDNLFLQPADVIKADAASAGLNPSVAAPHLGGLTFTKSSPPSEPRPAGPAGSTSTPKDQCLHLNPPKDPKKDTMTSAGGRYGYPMKPAGPGKPATAASADRIETPLPPLPVKGQPMIFQKTAPPSQPGSFGSAGRNRSASPPPHSEQPQPLKFANTIPPSKPGTFGSAGRTIPPPPRPEQTHPFMFANIAPPSQPGTFGSAARTIPPPAARAQLNAPEDCNADAMDTEANPAAPPFSASAAQTLFGGFGNSSPSTAGMFGSSNSNITPQGQTLRSLPTFPPGNSWVPSHYPDEMYAEFQSLPEDSLDIAVGSVSFPTPKDSQNTDVMDTEVSAASGPTHNDLTFSAPSQATSNMFSSVGNTFPSTFSFGQPNASTQPPQNSPATFPFDQPATSAFTHPQQNSLFAFPFGQPNTTTQPQQNSDSDAMMISPEKNSNGPLGRSLFDRIERPPTDASSSPATTSTAPPPTFSFGQNASSIPDFRQGLAPPPSSLFGDSSTSTSTPTASAESARDGLFSGVAAPTASPFDQNTDSEASQSSETPRASSLSKEQRKISEPNKHIEDKPTHSNPFGSIFVPKEQSPRSSSATAPSPFASKPHASTTSAIDARSSGGMFGSLTNNNGQGAANLFKSLNQTTNGQDTSNLFKLSNVNQGISDQTGSDSAGIQNQSTNMTGPFEFLKPSSDPSQSLNTSQKTTSKDARSPLRPSTTAQNSSGQHASIFSKPANAITNAADTNERTGKDGRKHSQPPPPPEHWATEEKKQYYTAYRLKQLDVGAEAKRLALGSARQTHRIKHLREFFLKTEKNIKAANGDRVRPVSGNPSPHRSDSEGGDVDPGWPPISWSSRKHSHDDQRSHYVDFAAPTASGKRKADDEVDRLQSQGSSGTGKRARVAEGEQVSYPSLPATAPNSKTSSMFKNILDKPAAMTNGELNSNSSSSPSKSSVPGPSVLTQSVNNKGSALQSTPNPFAASIAKWQADGSIGSTEDTPNLQALPPIGNSAPLFKASAAKARNGVTTKPLESPQIEAPTTKPANVSSSPIAFKPVANNVGASITPNAASNNFLAQFSNNSKSFEKQEMEKRKAADMDSDEDEAEWERRDAEEQSAKKQKREAEASKVKPKFVPGVGFVFETVDDENAKPAVTLEAPALDSHINELDKQHADYAKQQAAAADFVNPFTKFLKQDSGNEGSKNGDADDEEEGSDEEEQQASAAKKPIEGSLFDRTGASSSRANDDSDKDHLLKASNIGINMFGHVSGAAASVPGFNAINKTTSPAKTNPFGKLYSSTPNQNVFGAPSSARSLNTPGSGDKGDNTWNPESPIKFGGDTDAASKKRSREEDDTKEGQRNAKKVDVKNAPAVSITSPSPSKAPLGSLFGIAKPDATTETPSTTTSNLVAATPAGSIGSSFGFGISPIKPAPAFGSLFPPSNNPSTGVSRSTSPGATTGESATESNADGDDEGAEKHEQLNLTSGGPGEEDEDILYEVRAKALVWDDNKENDGEEKKGGWETKGLGPFRVMKNRKTGKARMLMRSDPAGRIIINSSICNQFKYDAPNKHTCRIPLLSASQKLETWLIKIGKDSDGADIARILEENKDQN